jgi:hypothetical protein
MHGVSSRNDRQRLGPVARRSSERSRPRLLATPLAVTVAVALAFTSAAFADSGDPVASGSFKLKPSRAFKNQLRRNGVVMRPKGFSLTEGSIDPVTGQGELSLKGRLHFKYGKQKVTYGQVAATLGANGYLTGHLLRRNGVLDRRATKLFKLRGGTAVRNGFGTNISGVKAALLSSAATKLNRKLGLHSLHSGSAGALSVSVQPQTVEVTGGTVRVVPDPDLGSVGNVAGKLNAHCINFNADNTAIAPGIKGGTVPNPYYDFPVTGGTISPLGTDGVVQGTGGIQLVNRRTGGGVPAACNSPTPVELATLQQTDLALNLLHDYVSAHVTVTGSVPTQGDLGVAPGSNLDLSKAAVSADPANHTVSINGIAVTINGATALVLNQTFVQPSSSFDMSNEFVIGNLFGTLNLTVTTR